jgi:hypothetical protein
MLCLGSTLLTCTDNGSGYSRRECASGCSETGGAHCADDAAGGAGGTNGTGGSAAGLSGAGGDADVPTPCTDTKIDDANCGACGYACVHGRHCDAGRCLPAWQPLATDSAPAARTRHAAGFVGGKYVVLGGSPTNFGLGMSSTSAYDLDADSWSELVPLNDARCSQAAVSTGTEILTFGGLTDCSNGSAVGPGLERYTPKGGWVRITGGAPKLRYNFAATWTGSAMFIFGGSDDKGPAVATGALYDPVDKTWAEADCGLANCERGDYDSAFADGNVVHIWGGAYGNAPAGLSYDLVGHAWSAWTVPANTDQHVAKRFADDGRRMYYLTATDVVSIYDRTSSSWLANDTAKMPAGFCTEAAAAWSGSELVAWSGDCGPGPANVGGRYQPPAPK